MPKKLNSTQKEKRNIEDFSSMTLEEQNKFIEDTFNELKVCLLGPKYAIK